MAYAINEVLEKCNIYYDNALISKESIVNKYLSFFTNSMNPETRTVGFALHTGSVCFDVISVVAIGLGCLSYNLSTNDEIIAALQLDDIVIYKDQRYYWKGCESKDDKMYICLEQDGSGKNGPIRKWIPYDKNKHLVTPYYGLSQVTDGRGIKRRKTNREDFLSHIFNLPISEIPTQIDISIIIVAERSFFADMCKNVSIEYGDGMRVELLDIIPMSYFTSSGIEYQFGVNPTKTEPVFKVTGNVSVARNMVLDKRGNSVIGLLVSGYTILRDSFSELSDLLRRKMLKFAFVTSPMYMELGTHIFDLYEDASIFACTKEFLTSFPNTVEVSNAYTDDLHQQIRNVIENRILDIKISGGLDKNTYNATWKAILAIKQSNWESELKDEFIASAHGMLKLLNTTVFTMCDMEQAILEGRINQSVVSPQIRIAELWNIAREAGVMQESCRFVVDVLEKKYNELLLVNPKANALQEYIKKHSAATTIAIIVPKAYYDDILIGSDPDLFASGNIVCVTPNKFDPRIKYDEIIVVGEMSNKKFDPLYCHSSKNVIVLLYECEENFFAYRKRKKQKYEQQLNSQLGISIKNMGVDFDDTNSDEIVESEMKSLATLDEYIDNYNVFDIRKIAVENAQIGGYIPISEVTHIGRFTTGEQILFSKYYSAVVFNDTACTVTEKFPCDLLSGDVLVFSKRNEYTQNIVDIVYERLQKSGRLSHQSIAMFEKSLYWKKVLREYKDYNNYSYRDVAKKLNEIGGSLQEVTVRKWLIADSHIVGPRNEKTLEYIAKVTKNSQLLENTHGYYEACRNVRRERRQILKLIAMAINDKLRGFVPPEGSDLEVVYDNVENLSEALELEYISELDESVNININLVNKPITEAEVLM